MPVRTIAPAVFVFLVVAHGTAAQVPGAPAPPPPSPLTLNDAIARALAVYPAVHVASNQVSAADANVAVSRVPYWPRLDLLWQENRATRDNVFGMLLPQAVVPPISGPVQAGSFSDSAWGSAAGMLFSWEPLDFGLRAANVAVATSEVDRTKANVALTRLQVTGATADAFLGLAAAEQALAAANANVRRFDVLTTSVRTLVANELRPGADASRADAELAAARIQAIQAEQRVDVARAALAELLAAPVTGLQIDSDSLLAKVPPVDDAAPSVPSHPAAQLQTAVVNTVRAREKALSDSYFPRITFQSALASRGTGASVPGAVTATNGLFPDTPNWAVGVSVTFPVFDFAAIRARSAVEAANERTEQARYEQVTAALNTQVLRANAAVKAARAIAAQTPVERAAAVEAEQRSRARYQAGLAPITEVADAERLLAQAEIDDAVAKLTVWRAAFLRAGAAGDFSTLMQVLGGQSSGSR